MKTPDEMVSGLHGVEVFLEEWSRRQSEIYDHYENLTEDRVQEAMNCFNHIYCLVSELAPGVGGNNAS